MSYQVSIFLENKLGHLERVTAVLSAAGINIRSIHINHTANGWGILNLVVSDPARAQKLLAGIFLCMRLAGDFAVQHANLIGAYNQMRRIACGQRLRLLLSKTRHQMAR